MSSQQSGEGEIRKALIEADLIDCMVALPGQLFFSTQIPVCLWFLARDKKNGLGEKGRKMKNRAGKVLFIDARKLGTMINRVQRKLTTEDIAKIAGTYHAFRGDAAGKGAKYADKLGFCKVATLDEIIANQCVLTPGRYVGAEDVEEDDEASEAKMKRLAATLREQMAEGTKLDKAISKNLARLGYDE
jgi:type I restriction enzyme M protein